MRRIDASTAFDMATFFSREDWALLLGEAAKLIQALTRQTSDLGDEASARAVETRERRAHPGVEFFAVLVDVCAHGSIDDVFLGTSEEVGRFGEQLVGGGADLDRTSGGHQNLQLGEWYLGTKGYLV